MFIKKSKKEKHMVIYVNGRVNKNSLTLPTLFSILIWKIYSLTKVN